MLLHISFINRILEEYIEDSLAFCSLDQHEVDIWRSEGAHGPGIEVVHITSIHTPLKSISIQLQLTIVEAWSTVELFILST